VNSNLPLASVHTMQEVYDKSLARTSFTLVMLGIASAMALALGIIGIYGVISCTVSQRKREIGIRLALGAQSGDVVSMVLKQGAKAGPHRRMYRRGRRFRFGTTHGEPVIWSDGPRSAHVCRCCGRAARGCSLRLLLSGTSRHEGRSDGRPSVTSEDALA